MPRRRIELDVKIKVMREHLRLINVEDISDEYGISRRSAYNWYDRIIEALPDILAEDKPGRKPKPTPAPPF